VDVQRCLCPREERAVVHARVNLLLVTGAGVHDEIVTALTPLLREPLGAVDGWPSESGPECKTLIVRAIHAFTPDEQRAMLAWLLDRRPRVQIICLSAEPLFPRVVRGNFLADLYYHLNTVYVRLDQAAWKNEGS
jgi:hypothetical protein